MNLLYPKSCVVLLLLLSPARSFAESCSLCGKEMGNHGCPCIYEKKTIQPKPNATSPIIPALVAPRTARKVHKVSEKLYEGKSYADVNCIDFILGALKESGFNFDEKLQNEIKMAELGALLDSKSSKEQKKKGKELIESGDDKAKGIVSVLANNSMGKEIIDAKGSPENLQPGDIVQYWSVTKDYVSGHSAVVDRVDMKQKRVYFLGSHRTIGGVGPLDMRISTIKSKTQFWAVRPE